MTTETLPERLAKCVRLRWEERARDFWTSSDELGLHYTITNYSGMYRQFKLEGRGGFFYKTSYHDTFEAAKAAAQADYTARILAALDLDAIARLVAEAVEREREAIAAFIESHAYCTNGGDTCLEPSRFPGMDRHHATIAAAIRAREGGKA